MFKRNHFERSVWDFEYRSVLIITLLTTLLTEDVVIISSTVASDPLVIPRAAFEGTYSTVPPTEFLFVFFRALEFPRSSPTSFRKLIEQIFYRITFLEEQYVDPSRWTVNQRRIPSCLSGVLYPSFHIWCKITDKDTGLTSYIIEDQNIQEASNDQTNTNNVRTAV